jgi:predicted RNA binding protein with dsRBD fold (UPF0201 family)
MADASHSSAPADDASPKPKKLTTEEVDGLTKRIYEDSMARKQRSVLEIEAKVYKTEEPKKLDKAVIEASVTRQVNDEMERRKKRNEDLKNKYYKDAAPKTMSSTEVEDSVRRVYSDAMRHKSDTITKLEKKFAPAAPVTKKINDEERKTMAERLAKPKKTEMTTAEINKLYGF